MNLFYLTAICCIPISNPEARLREQEIFRKVASDAVEHAGIIASGQPRCRWNVNENKKIRSATSSV
jgi:hypothetical protein